jgi:nitrite reductase (NAD(P)H)
VDDIYAIGDCVCWNSQTFGIIAPGVEMADIVSFNLTEGKSTGLRKFGRPDLSTKLKLLGINVASFGDYFADKASPERPHTDAESASSGPRVKALTYKDPFSAVYKKYLFTSDGEHLLGGMMIGDTRDYVKLTQMVRNRTRLTMPPGEFILGAQKDGQDEGADL